jgi:hypothetical protein
LAVPVTLLALSALLVVWGCEAGNQDGAISGPLFGKDKCEPWPGCKGGGGDDGGAKEGDTLTVVLADGMATPVSLLQEIEVTFSNGRFFEVSKEGVHTFKTTTNLESTQAIAENLTNGPCFASPADADPAIVDMLRARLVDPQRQRGFTMTVDKRGLDAPGDTSQSSHHRLSVSWREAAFDLQDALIMVRVASSTDLGGATVVLDDGRFDTIKETGVKLTITGGTARAFTPSTDPQVKLLCPNVDEFKVFVAPLPTP